MRVWAVDKYEGAMQMRACSRRIASASEIGQLGVWGGRGGWCGAVQVVGVERSRWLVWSGRWWWVWCERSRWLMCERVSWFRDEVGNFFYNGDMRNSKTVMTGEAVDKSVHNLWITFLCLDVEYIIVCINIVCLLKLLYEL